MLRTLQEQEREATAAEQQVLGRWTSWGALPKVFDEHDETHTELRGQLRGLLDEREWTAARRTVLNAHYTSPMYAQQIWCALEGLGFTGGEVLEPGCGAGVFMGVAPQSARVTGIELDPVTAQIAHALYPQHQVRAESFTDSPFPEGTFDAAIGNVPFADVRLLDPVHNPGRAHSMHNHFILKSLALTRPGGMVAVLTSHWTLDAHGATAREAMAQRADLISAVRLPTGAHRVVAGTEAVTDLLVFRVREPDRAPAPDTSWLTTSMMNIPGVQPDSPEAQIRINDWFNPDLSHRPVAAPPVVLGQLRYGHGMYSHESLVVTATELDTLGQRLGAALDWDVAQARAADLVFTDPPATGRVTPSQVVAPVAGAPDIARFDGHITRDEHGDFHQVDTGVVIDVEVPKSAVAHLAGLLQLRDTATALLQAEASSSQDNPETDRLRRQLNLSYDGFVSRFGPINTVKVSESSRLDKTGQPIVSRRFPAAMRIFRGDPHAAVVQGLEDYDEATGAAAKAPIFDRRVVAPVTIATTADTPQDAVAIVLDQVGHVELDQVAALLGVDPPQARSMLGELVYADPADPDRLIPAAAYLSGDVREALRTAQAHLGSNPDLAVNVAALAKVIPPDLGPGQIEAKLGAVWIPARDVQQFLTETLDDRSVRVINPQGSMWDVTGNKHAQAATATWGTERMDALSMAERLMTQKRIVVEDTITDGYSERRVINPVETEAAQAKAEQLADRFAGWVWEDPDRADRLVTDYNNRFNAVVLRSYRDDGARLTLPGLAAWFTPHEHQRSAVARMRAEPSVGLFHQVGAGKTAEMVMGAAELKRLGLVNKPAIVVPNHMLEQFTREWMMLYPRANILAAASDDLRGEGRRRFVGRVATGDWDGVIMTQGAFGSIGVGSDAFERYTSRELADLRKALTNVQGSDAPRSTVKSLEKSIERAEQRLKAALGTRRDPGLTWEETGIDYLMVDELHMYKNLAIASNIPDVHTTGSQRAQDLDMKLMLLRERAGSSGRVMTGATATPIANTMAEAYVMQRYLRPDLLEGAGVTNFDTWAATFGTQTTDLEMAPQGGGWRMKTRFAKFQNLPELLRLWHVAADVKTSADLALNVPDLAARPSDGQRAPETVMVPPSAEMTQFMASLGERAELVKARAVPPEEDNMLAICSDGRKAALDLAMITGAPVDLGGLPSKLDVAAARIHAIWVEHRDRVYPLSAENSQPHPTPGGLQIVFADLGTPNTDGRWSAYEALRDKLVQAGMAPGRVAFVHDANNDAKKARLFAACRSGGVDVLIGSTAKMGVGTNIQHRAVALHHLDCPWRPADVEQREGRILRQGNQNPQVRILRYATEKSFDAYMWQTVERKAKFIDQVMHGNLDRRDAADIDSSSTLSFAEVKALAAGNPLLLRRTEAEADVAKLTRLETAHRREQSHRHNQASQRGHQITRLTETTIPALERAIAARQATSGEKFAATINGQHLTDRAAAAAQLRAALYPHMFKLDKFTRPELAITDAITLGGHTFDAIAKTGTLGAEASLTLNIRGLPEASVGATLADLRGEGIGLISRLENRIHRLDQDLAQAHQALATARKEQTEATSKIGEPFPHAEQLRQARATLEQVTHELAESETTTTPPQDATNDPATHPKTAAAERHSAPGTISEHREPEHMEPEYGEPGDRNRQPNTPQRPTSAPSTSRPASGMDAPSI